MAQYFVDTNEWGDDIPAAWGVLVGADVWSMETDSQDAGRKVLKATVPSDGNHILSWASAESGIDCSLAVELHCTFRVLSYSNGGTLMAGPVSDAVEDGGQHAFFGAGGFWHSSSGPNYRPSTSVRRLSDGSQSNDFGPSVYGTAQPASTVFHVRVLCAADPGDDSGREIQVKVWKEGEAEPASYQTSQTVSTGWEWNHGDGEVGFMAVRDEEFEFLTLGIGTEGDAAPDEEIPVPDQAVVTVDSVGSDEASFSTSPYSHPEGTAHKSTQWQVSLDSDFSTTVIDETSETDLESYDAELLSPGLDYFLRARHIAADDLEGEWSNSVSFSTTSCDEAPVTRVGEVGIENLTASVDTETEYLSVRYRLSSGGSVVETTADKTGSERFTHTFTGLSAGTTYEVEALVERDCGFSPYSDAIEVTTLTEVPSDGTLGCPPVPASYYWNPDSNPPSYQTWRGTGWFTPHPGQPLRGVVTCRLRWPNAFTWDIEISDDLGATYTPLASDVESGGADGDNLLTFDVELDTTTLTDGDSYRLKATSQGDGTEIESLSFVVDNAEEYVYHDNREGENLGSYKILWGTNKPGDPLGNPTREFPLTGNWYYQPKDGAYFSPRGTPWTCLADLDAGIGYGGDMTVVFHVWSGEGGRFGLQGMLDCEAWKAGIAMFANGSGEVGVDTEVQEDQVGLFIGIRNLLAYGIGCCDDLYTSVVAKLTAEGRPAASGAFATLDVEGSSATTGSLQDITKFFHKCDFNVPRYPGDDGNEADFVGNSILIRQGKTPGENLISRETCGRRYSMYAVRAKVEIDPTDAKRIHIRARVDGPGVEEPDSGYWHFDEWIATSVEWGKGHIGLASQQTVRPTYGNPEGVRIFKTYAGRTYDVEITEEEEEEEIEVGNLIQEGEPCTLILEAYEADEKTIAWTVGTDRNHENPYLVEPQNYGEQEISVIDGGVTIGQVEAIVIDKAQTPGDQDSGWLTERIMDGGKGIIHGRRFRLIRYVSPDDGWVVIADGPAGPPRLDESFAAYRWTIRDTRETERKVEAFTRLNQTTWVMPQGYPDGWGKYEDGLGVEQWLADPREPLTGTYEILASGRGAVNLIDDPDYWPDIAGSDQWEAAEEVVIPSGAANALFADTELAEPPLAFSAHWTWPDLEVWWRAAGTEDEWTVVQVEETWDGSSSTDPGVLPGQSEYARELVQIQGREGGAPVTLDGDGNITSHIPVYLEGTRTPVLAASRILVKGLEQPASAGDLPAEDQEIEVAVRYKGEPTEWAPILIQHNDDGSEKTIGQLLEEMYDGEWSPRREVDLDPPLVGTTEEIVPTGIRYDPDALAAMTDPVGLLVITESTDDLRGWTEKNLYGPSGWIPALDRNLYISPVSQVPPADFSTATEITDEFTEPVPGWNAGEAIVNILTFGYKRWFTTAIGRSENLAWLESKNIKIEFRDEDSIDEHGEETAGYETLAFSGAGTQEGNPATASIEEELGWQHAQNRKIYVFDRYRDGAQVVDIPVRRSLTAGHRAGDWVTIDLSWIPDYVLKRRGGTFGGQILAIADLDCAWRRLLVEEALPVEVS